MKELWMSGFSLAALRPGAPEASATFVEGHAAAWGRMAWGDMFVEKSVELLKRVRGAASGGR